MSLCDKFQQSVIIQSSNNYKYLLTHICSEYTSERTLIDGNVEGNKSGCGGEKVPEDRSSHLRFLLCMSLWEKGGEGKGVCGPGQFVSLSLSDCLTGKLHPSYLSENRGVNMS